MNDSAYAFWTLHNWLDPQLMAALGQGQEGEFPGLVKGGCGRTICNEGHERRESRTGGSEKALKMRLIRMKDPGRGKIGEVVETSSEDTQAELNGRGKWVEWDQAGWLCLGIFLLHGHLQHHRHACTWQISTCSWKIDVL